MTVDEMITVLQELSSKGHGSVDVVITEKSYGMTEQNTNVELHLVSTEHFESKEWYIKTYWKTESNNDTYLVRGTPFLFIGRV